MNSMLGIDLTHPDKRLFGVDGPHKSEFVSYFVTIGDVMASHLSKRPLMAQRYPRGISEAGFVQQDFGEVLPEWMDRAEVAKSDGTVVHPLVSSPRGLVWLANQDCVTLHRWLSRTDRLERPDRLVIDLDPSGDEFEPVREAAIVICDLCERIGLVPFVQTTGSRGLHVVSPIRAEATFDSVREFAKDLASYAADQEPDKLTVAVRKKERADRVYLDVLRNAYGQTAVAPYAVRARPGAPVATPLWRGELDSHRLRSDAFTIRDIPDRLEGCGDPWAGMGRRARSLSGPRERLDRIRASTG